MYEHDQLYERKIKVKSRDGEDLRGALRGMKKEVERGKKGGRRVRGIGKWRIGVW